MDFKQNQKINQVTEKTLVVGIDIAKRKHFACFVDDRGRVLQKSFSVLQSSDGFDRFYQRILTAMKENEKTEVIVGIEPTVHYWLNLAYFLEERGIPLAMINPMHVKRTKEEDSSQLKAWQGIIDILIKKQRSSAADSIKKTMFILVSIE
ncbi:hypothetical protein J2S17_005304 [Cytobacillus purgationiresistens]|uniref:Transposase IS110-like N-terminal domain-containing protein n=1 Tax=Cytobacillus purgationiresistens TaxID=863449 RepID=A0ABU0AQ09_9BACI|nr:hypothetical protein [Cytobacillus purgationiresistens]